MAFAISFVVYTLAILVVGLVTARRGVGTDEDYYLGGRTLGPWLAALSASASAESGWVTLGLVGLAFSNGYSAYWIMPGCLIGFAVNWFVVAPRLRRQSGALGAITIPDYFARRFAEGIPVLRIMSVVVILVAMCLYVAAQFAAAGEAFDAAFPSVGESISMTNGGYRTGVLIGAAVVLVYTVLGGFRASCWTDAVQALVMVGVLFVFPVWMLATTGGYGGLDDAFGAAGDDSAKLLRWGFEATGFTLVGVLLGSGALGINLGFVGSPHILVRFMAMRDRRDAVVAGTVSMVWGIMIFWGAITIGLLVRAFAIEAAAGAEDVAWAMPLVEDPAGKKESALVLAAGGLLPGVVAGLALSAIFAAICSTADSQLVVAASACTSDIWRKVFGGSAEGTGHMLINRLTIFGLGLGGMALVIGGQVEIFDYVLKFAWAILGASFGPQVLLALLWRRSTWAGAVAGMGVGLTVAIGWKLAQDNGWFPAEGFLATLGAFYNLTIAFSLATAVNIVVSLMTKPPAGAGEIFTSPER